MLNVWVSYNVNFWSFNNFKDRGKVLREPVARGHYGDNGGASPLGTSDSKGGQDSVVDAWGSNSNVHPRFSDFSVAKNQRSAKAFNGNRDYPEKHRDLYEHNADRPMSSVQLQGKTRTRSQLSSVGSNVPTTLNDIFISVKTTSKFHSSRIRLIQKTWYTLARQQAYFFTDGDDSELNRDLGGHLINTNCTAGHSRRALSCKMAVEIDFYMASRKRWFCHLDDDVYLNVPRLLKLLQKYNHKQDWYLGKPSLRHPLEVADRENPGMKLTFWFATGGAGFCISRSLALKMAPYASGGRFMTTAEQIRLPDDCTIGYIIEHLLKQHLTIIDQFHSHLEALYLIKQHQLETQVTFSYSKYSGKLNVLNIEGFDEKEDPTRLKSLHCTLFPTFHECKGFPGNDKE